MAVTKIAYPAIGERAAMSSTQRSPTSHRHADQNERDYQAFLRTVRSGHLEALEGV